MNDPFAIMGTMLAAFVAGLVALAVYIARTKVEIKKTPPSEPPAYLRARLGGEEVVAELNEGSFTIGRDDRRNVVLPDALFLHDPERLVSRVHASIDYDNGTYFVRDAGSKHGLWLNGQRVSGRRPLENKDRLRLSDENGIEVTFVDPRKTAPVEFPPSPWGDWEFLKYLNSGGMARIYLGRSIVEGGNARREEIAIKVPRHGTPNFDELCDMLRREGAFMQPLDHPNVVKVYRFGTLPCDWPYLAMEVVDGGTLRDLMKLHGGRLPEDKALEILRQMAGAVDYIHSRGVIHCDIKPDNVLLIGDTVKLADFGIAISANERYGLDWCSYHYISPEHYEGESIDHRSDLYMLGCLTHEMLTGRVPFEGDKEAVGGRKVQEDGPSIRERFGELGITPKTDELVRRMLRRKPAERPGDAAEAISRR